MEHYEQIGVAVVVVVVVVVVVAVVVVAVVVVAVVDVVVVVVVAVVVVAVVVVVVVVAVVVVAVVVAVVVVAVVVVVVVPLVAHYWFCLAFSFHFPFCPSPSVTHASKGFVHWCQLSLTFRETANIRFAHFNKGQLLECVNTYCVLKNSNILLQRHTLARQWLHLCVSDSPK